MGPIDTQIDYSNSTSDDEDDVDESYPAKHIKELKIMSNFKFLIHYCYTFTASKLL